MAQDESVKFSWFPKFTSVMEKLPEDMQPVFVMAVVRYGAYGEEPDLPWPLDAIFESVREDIDNSKKASKSGRDGGRGNAKKAHADDAKGSVDESETPLERPLSTPEKAPLEKPKAIPSHTKPVQAMAVQAKPDQGMMAPAPADEGANVIDLDAASKRTPYDPEPFTPPTIEEVRTYFGANGLLAPPDEFWALYQSQGWRKANGLPITDWHAQALSFARRQREFDAKKPPEQRQVVAPIPKAENAVDWDAEVARYDAQLARLQAGEA